MSAQLVTFAPTVAISAKLLQVDPLQRRIRKPVSLLALSVQDRLIWLFEMTAAVRFVGAAGNAEAACVTALAVLE